MQVFWLGMVKNGSGQSGLWTLKLTVIEEWTDGINCFFFSRLHKFMQIKKCFLKADQKCFGLAWSKMGVATLLMGI